MPEAFFLLASAAIPYLEDPDWGRIVATSSFVAHVYAADGLFAATAAAIESLAKTLAVQLAPSGITVNSVNIRPNSSLLSARWARISGQILKKNIFAMVRKNVPTFLFLNIFC